MNSHVLRRAVMMLLCLCCLLVFSLPTSADEPDSSTDQLATDTADPDNDAPKNGYWRVEDYERYSLEEFLELPALQETIDPEAVDYPLLHAAIFYLTNAERVSRQISPLLHHPALELAAQQHSQAMYERRFFSHNSPVPGHRRPRDRATSAGFVGRGFGENIARSHALQTIRGRGMHTPDQNGGYFSYTLRGDPIPHHTYLSQAQAFVAQWMGSTGHRQNILRSTYTHLGVGAHFFLYSGFHGIDSFYSTQKFAIE